MRLLTKLGIAAFCLILFILLLFGLWVQAYQRLVNEGSALEDKQCFNVNPLIIKRKNSYIKTIQIAKANGSQEEYWTEQMNYLDISKKYVFMQAKWLEEHKSFMNRWDYKLFLPKIVQAAGIAQYESRWAEMQSTDAVIQMFETEDENKWKELVQVIIDQKKKEEEADAELDRLMSTPPPFDLRFRFIKVPPTKCPEENYKIPNVPELLSPPQQTEHGPISYLAH